MVKARKKRDVDALMDKVGKLEHVRAMHGLLSLPLIMRLQFCFSMLFPKRAREQLHAYYETRMEELNALLEKW